MRCCDGAGFGNESTRYKSGASSATSGTFSGDSIALLSLGHSNKSLDEFLALVGSAGIRTIVDVRRRPRSRWPQFNGPALERALTERALRYEWLGDDLGGFREGGYDAWMASEEFRRGIVELEALAGRSRVGFMCSEGQPWACHRRFVARALSQRGHEVSHLLPDGVVVPEDPQLALPDL